MAFGGPSVMRFTADTQLFYQLLEIDKGASEKDIKKAYKKQAMRCHPDKGGDPEQFKDLQRAYEVLVDAGLRAKYDEFGEDGLKENFYCAESQAPPAEHRAEGSEHDSSGGGLAVGTCMVATVATSLCGASAAAGLALCGAGQALRGLGGRHRGGAMLATALGFFLLWPWIAPTEGLSSMAWTLLMYAAMAAGLFLLGTRWSHLPAFLPYLLFVGYLLLFLLVPTKSSEQVLMELPGYVLIEESGEVTSDSAFAESAALFTWGVVGIHQVLSRLSSAPQHQHQQKMPGAESQGV